METRFSAEYYESQSERLEAMRGVIKPEEELEKYVAFFKENMVEATDDQIEKVKSVYAQLVFDKIRSELIEKKGMYLAVLNDPNCLGYTTVFQTVQAAGEIVKVWEYNCYKLSKFRKQYDCKNEARK